MKLKDIIISRRRWGCGDKGGLLRHNETGLQCCLGFVCRAFGVPPSAIVGRGMPGDTLDMYRDKLPGWLLSMRSNVDVHKAALANDDPTLTNEKREKRTTAIFRRHGLRAVFKA